MEIIVKELAKITNELGFSAAVSIFLIIWLVITLDRSLKNISVKLDELAEMDKAIADILGRIANHQKLHTTILKELGKSQGITIVEGDS